MVRKGAMKSGRPEGVRLVPGLDVRAGQTIAGRYRVEELLGSGASGVVFSARNVLLREQVTLKILASYTEGHEERAEASPREGTPRVAPAELARRAHRRHRRDRGRHALRGDRVR